MTNPFANAGAQAPQTQQPAAQAAPQPQAQPEAQPQQPAAQAAPAGNLSDMFSLGASGGDGAKIKDDMGAAVLIFPTEFISQMQTVNGPSDCVRADWVVLDGPNQGAVREGFLIFNKVLVNTLKAALGNPAQRMALGVVGLGEAKPGKNAPITLLVPDDNQVALARQAVTAYGWDKRLS